MSNKPRQANRSWVLAGWGTAALVMLPSSGVLADSASRTLGRHLTAQQTRGISKAHRVGRGELGRDGRPAGIYPDGKSNFTRRQLLRKARILKAHDLDRTARRQLMRAGIVGDRYEIQTTYPNSRVKITKWVEASSPSGACSIVRSSEKPGAVVEATGCVRTAGYLKRLATEAKERDRANAFYRYYNGY